MALIDVRCRGCGRRLGVAREPRYRVYCDAFCATDPPANDNEARDAVIELLEQRGWTHERIATRLGLSRQRVAQILAQRAAVYR